MPSERRFTDQQVAIVLRTAAELQERDGSPGSVGRGLTLQQLEQIAAEAGIEAAVVRRAVARLDEGPGAEGHNAFIGAPTAIVVERVVEGEIAVADFEAFLATIRRVTGQLGESSGVGRLFGWKGIFDEATCEISISSEAGATTVRVRLAPEQHILGQFMLKGLLGGFGGGLIGAAAASFVLGGAGVLVGLAIAGSGYVAARRGYRRDVTTLRSRAADLADALAAICPGTGEKTNAAARAIALAPAVESR